jgi:hypothetical protein
MKIMKTFLKWNLWVCLFAVTVLTSCKDDNDDGNTEDPNYVFKVADENKTLTCDAKGKTFVIDVTSTKNNSKVSFEVESSPEWAPAEIEMTALTVTVKENTTKEPRNGGKIVLIQDETGTKLEITVNQEEVTSSLNLEAGYTTARCKVLTIEPDITGYNEAPVYEWTCKKVGADGDAKVIGTEKNLPFIQLEAGTFDVSLKVTDENIGESKSTKVTVTQEETAYSAFISEVFAYRPAPGSKITSNPTDTEVIAIKKAKDLLKGKDINSNNTAATELVQLGSLGGYVTFGFDHTVVNVPGKRDFRVNSMISSSNMFFPSVIMVALDKNGNGKPDDDEWYEIKGSEHDNTKTMKGLTITYENEDVNYATCKCIWKTSLEESGSMKAENYPMAGLGWPQWIKEVITFEGVTRLPDNAVMSGMFPSSYTQYEYGYACNASLGKEGGAKKCAIDISWAIDKNGNKVNLPGIDFVKVYTGVLQDLGMYYGYSWANVAGATDCHLKGEDFDSDVE